MKSNMLWSVLACFIGSGAGQAQLLHGHERALTALAFSADGHMLASASDDGTLRSWDLKTAQPRLIKKYERRVSCLSVSPDGKTLAAAAQGEPVELWHLASAQLSRTFVVPIVNERTMVTSLAFSPQGDKLAVGLGAFALRLTRCEVMVWELGTEKVLTTIQLGLRGYPTLAFTRDGSKLAVASGSEAQLFDVGTGKPLLKLITASVPGRRGAAYSVAVSPDGTALATVEGWANEPPPVNQGTFEQAVLWDLATGKQLAVLPREKEKIAAVAFSHDSKRLFTASWDGTVKIYDISSGTQLDTLQGEIGKVNCLAISPDGQTLAGGGLSGTIQLWKVP